MFVFPPALGGKNLNQGARTIWQQNVFFWFYFSFQFSLRNGTTIYEEWIHMQHPGLLVCMENLYNKWDFWQSISCPSGNICHLLRSGWVRNWVQNSFPSLLGQDRAGSCRCFSFLFWIFPHFCNIIVNTHPWSQIILTPFTGAGGSEHASKSFRRSWFPQYGNVIFCSHK